MSIVFVLMLTMTAPSDPWLGSDKLIHFGATAVLGASGYAIGAELGEERAPRLVVGATLSLGAAAAKELADWAGSGDPSWRDFAWSTAGAAAGLLIAWAIDVWLAEPAAPIFLRW